MDAFDMYIAYQVKRDQALATERAESVAKARADLLAAEAVAKERAAEVFWTLVDLGIGAVALAWAWP